MVRRTAIVLVAALAVVACGVTGDAWPQEVRDNFLDACLTSSEGEEDYCRCVLDDLEAAFTAEEFEVLEQELAGGEDVPPELEVIIDGCIEEHLS